MEILISDSKVMVDRDGARTPASDVRTLQVKARPLVRNGPEQTHYPPPIAVQPAADEITGYGTKQTP